jgi:uncharacterized protein YgiM (DUF1202 family)
MRRDAAPWRIMLPLCLLMLAALACGGFQLRSSATPKATAKTLTPGPGSTSTALAAAQQSPTPEATAEATSTPTPAAAVGGLTSGKNARVAASGGVNVRDKAGTAGKQVGKLNPGAVVKILGGPSQADNYTWWQIDNGAGLTGWVSMGPANDPWLQPESGSSPAITPAAGGGKLVNRAIKVGDRVQVTTQEGKVLTVRESASKDANAVARVLPGTQFTVKSGPVQKDNFTWWQLESDQAKGWAAEGDGTDHWLTPVEP